MQPGCVQNEYKVLFQINVMQSLISTLLGFESIFSNEVKSPTEPQI
jgi:hypothetical protein